MPSSSSTVVIAGGVLSSTDTVLSAIFIPIFFLIGLFFHFRIFRAYQKKFIWSGLCFSYCMARIVALALRIAIVKNPTSKSLNIVAQILVAAGVALLFVVNLQMSRRFFGQLHPHHAVIVERLITGSVIAILPTLVMVITTVIQSYLTHDRHILSIDRTIRLVVSCIFTILPFIPIPVVCIVLGLKMASPGGLNGPNTTISDEESPTNKPNDLEGFELANSSGMLSVDNDTLADSATVGEKKDSPAQVTMRQRGEPETGFGPVPASRKAILETAAVIVIPAILLTFEQGVRTAQAFYVHQPGQAIPWHMTKAAFWICIFGLEVVSVLIFGLAQLPQRFSHLRIL